MRVKIALYFLLFVPIFSFAQEIRVSSPEEFVAAIQNGVTIILKSGTYNLSSVMSDQKSNTIWKDVTDGYELQIHDVSNLTIKSEGKVTIVVKPRYAWVLAFYNCRNISISGITFGHLESGYCDGGVLGFVGCNGIDIVNCVLYGSGKEGLGIESVDNFIFKNSTIRDCSYDLMTIIGSSSLLFENVLFTKTGEFNLIDTERSTDVRFFKCSFTENRNSEFMPYFFSFGDDSGVFTLEKCKFINNQVGYLSNKSEKLKLKKCSFTGNTFVDIKNK
ncbi:MAG: right-handed parallel beta-helix repeat-containing protein [Bacteroidota bacterium]